MVAKVSQELFTSIFIVVSEKGLVRDLLQVSSVIRSVSVSVKVSVKRTCKQKNGKSDLKLKLIRCSMGRPEVIISVVR
jgi:hypothetical protein